MEVNVQNTCVRVYTQDETINLQPLVVLTQDLSGVAQQDTLVQGITDIRDDISHIDIDTSTLAKQGTNASATLTATQTAATNAYASAEAAKTGVVDGNDTAVGVAKELRSEVGTGSDTAAESGTLFAVVKWVKDKVKSIFNLVGSPASGQPSTLFAAIAAGGGGGGDAQESTSQEILSRIGSAGSGQSATLFGAIGDVALSATTLQSLADSWAAMVTNRNSLSGWVFAEGIDIQSVYDIIANLSSLVSVEDNVLVLYKGGNAVFNNRGQLKSIKFNEVVTVTGASSEWRSNNILELIDFPKMETFGTVNWCIAQDPELRKVNFPSLTTYTASGNPGPFYQCYKLIDIVVGPISVNFAMLSSWDPTVALDSTSSSLVEAGEPFANNLEKLLYNIREHIANRLADVTGIGRTINFSSNIKAAIQAETGQATANAFTSKGWTIA